MGRLDWDKWRRDNPEPSKKWAREPCPRCGAKTLAEAAGQCRPFQLPSGEYDCPSDEDAPTWFGFLHAHSKDWANWNDKFWGACAYDEGYTDKLD